MPPPIGGLLKPDLTLPPAFAEFVDIEPIRLRDCVPEPMPPEIDVIEPAIGAKLKDDRVVSIDELLRA
jgi:hypothetical protein